MSNPAQPRPLSTQEYRNRIIGMVRSGNADIQYDADGQLIIHTDLYRWADGTIHTEVEQK